MALVATPVTSHLGGTTFGGFGAVAIATGTRIRATTVLAGASIVSSLLSPTSFFPFAMASTFPVATAGAAAGEDSMASMASMAGVEPLLPVSTKSAVRFSNSLDDVIAADTITRCKVPCLNLGFGIQRINGNCVHHVIVEGQSCCTRLCCNILHPTHFLQGVAPWRYLTTIMAPGEVGFGPRRLRAVHARRTSHASLGEAHMCQIHLPLALLRTVDRKLHASACMCIILRLYPLSTRIEFPLSNFPTGMH